MTYLLLFYEFFKAGLFAIGGGLATLPFLYDMADKYPWFTRTDLANMIAVSESTPGPIGVNMATYAGYTTGGIFGALIATFGLILPSLIIIILIARFLESFNDNRFVQSAFYGLRPVVCALISVAAFEVLEITIITLDRFQASGSLLDLLDWRNLLIFAVLLTAILKTKWHPIIFIGIGAVLGIVLKL